MIADSNLLIGLVEKKKQEVNKGRTGSYASAKLRVPRVVADAGFTLQTKGGDPIGVVPSSNKHGHVITDEEDDNNCQVA